ncbi:MAG TPA: MarR family transcriptional regulator [Pseudonocardiaceae bacterium]|nr:MarR family transcriptional regulator [Pseudonocardiaceae bacterium]
MTSDRELLALWRNVYELHAAIRAALSRRLDEAGGCSLVEHDLMSWLEVDRDRRPRMQELAATLGMTPGGATRLVDRLVRRGWVQRLQLPGNRREVYTELTDDGRAALAPARAAYFQALRECLPGGDIVAATELTGALLREIKPDEEIGC